jgi:hypothetical protein
MKRALSSQFLVESIESERCVSHLKYLQLFASFNRSHLDVHNFFLMGVDISFFSERCGISFYVTGVGHLQFANNCKKVVNNDEKFLICNRSWASYMVKFMTPFRGY